MRCALVVGLLVFALGGCASQSVSFRSLPPEDPAAENAAALESAAAFAAAAKPNAAETKANAAETKESTAASETARASPGAPETLPPVTPEDAPSMYTYDPGYRVN